MTYLSKDERREAILQAAMRVALNDGFTGMTVRNIAAEAKVATGQVHHHFASAGELKAQAFISLIRALLVDIIRAGEQAKAFTLKDTAENVAWRLIGLVCGLDGLYALSMPEMDDAAFNQHLKTLITLELG